MKEIKVELGDIWKKKEFGMWLTSRDRNIKEGDRNTAYFHAVANQRRRKNHLSVLVGDEGPVFTTTNMLDVASKFYKNLFGFESKPKIHLGEHFWSEDEKKFY